jgi:hypothetical protein
MWIPQVGDRVMTPFGPGEVVGIALAHPDVSRAYLWGASVFEGGPYVVRLDTGEVGGYPAGRLAPAGAVGSDGQGSPGGWAGQKMSPSAAVKSPQKRS